MSDPSAFGFGKFVPGFDFLQSLASSAASPKAPGSAMAGMSNWVAPTLSVDELDKRIQELKAVQFWLEQNGTALKATIQALEVQKMTLSTLQGMNVNMAELAKAFTVATPAAPQAETPSPSAATEAAAPEATAAPARPARRKPKAAADSPEPRASVDPLQWWGALTQQFQNIATAAMQEAAGPRPQAPAAKPAASAASARPRTASARASAAPRAAAASARRRRS